MKKTKIKSVRRKAKRYCEPHSPHPWTLDEVDLIIYDANRQPVVNFDPRGMAHKPHMTNAQISVIEANARVTAAAPDLLAALQLILDGADEDLNDGSSSLGDERLGLAEARVAVGKADQFYC